MAIDAKHLADVLDTAEVVYDRTRVRDAYDRMAGQITDRLADKEPVIIVVLTGGLIPAGHLLTRLAFPLQLDYLHATRYLGEVRGGELVWIARPSIPLEGRTVLIVDDILDERLTLDAILAFCREEGAREVLSAVLVEKRHDRRPAHIRADFCGLVVDDRYVFGCGMDYRGYYRNLPEIYAVTT